MLDAGGGGGGLDGFGSDLMAVVDDIRRLAMEKSQQEWERYLQSESAGYQTTPVEPWEAVEGEFRSRINDCLTAFEPFTEGRPSAFTSMANGLVEQDGVWGALVKGKTEDIPLVMNIVDDWHGTAAIAFHTNFLALFESAADHQLAYVEELVRALNAYKGLLKEARENIMRLAEDTRAALEELGAGSGGSVSHFFTVLGIVATAVSAPTGVGVAISAAGFASGLLEEARGEPDRVERTIGGDDVASVLEKMTEEIRRLRRLIDDEEEVIGRGLDKDLAQFDGEGRYNFMVERPDIAYTGGRTTAGFERPQDGREVSVIYSDLYVAGSVHLSAAAYNYEQARQRLGQVKDQESAAFGPWFSYTRNKWQGAVQRLEGVLVSTRHNCEDAGTALCAVASAYAQADNVSAETVRRVGEYVGAAERTTLDTGAMPAQPVGAAP